MNKSAWGVLAILLLCSGRAQAGVDVELLHSDDRGVRVRVTVTGGAVEAGEDGLARVLLDGAVVGGQPGLPALPMLARWVALPPRATPQLRILSSQVDELGTGRLVPIETPGLIPGEDGSPQLVQSWDFSEDYDGFRSTLQDAVTLGTQVFQRRQHMVSLLIEPVLYDAASGRVQILRELEFEVTWAASTDRSLPRASDATVLSAVLNPAQARQWGTYSPRQEQMLAAASAPASRAAENLDPGALAADGIRLRVNQTGIVRVAVADLIGGAGLPTDVPRSWVRLAQLRASNPGTPGYPAPAVVDVPLHFFGNPDPSGLIQSTDEFFFRALRVEEDVDTLLVGGELLQPPLPWGESSTTDTIGPRNAADHFNRDNIYFVYVMEPPQEGWARMEAVTLPPSLGSPEPTYLRIEHFEGNQGYREEPYDSWVERYAWNSKNEVDVVRSLRLWDPVPGADLVVRWAAGADRSGLGAAPVTFSIRQGATELPLTQVPLTNNGVMTDWSTTLPAPGLSNGPVDFRVRRMFNGGDVAVNTFLDHVELEYAAGFTASIDQLQFGTGSPAADVDVEVQGYSRADLVCFDLTDPREPRWIDLGPDNVENRTAGGPDNFALSLRVNQSGGVEREFVAAPRVRLPRVGRAAMERDPVAELFDEVNNVQILAIGPEILRTQAERWVDWREQTYADQGWHGAYIDVQQIYDEFSGGLQSPWAIRQFTEWAWLNWNAVALVLVGDGSEDVLNGGGNAGPNLVPPSLHIQSITDGRELLASDKWYGIFGYVPQGNQVYPKGLRVTSDVVVGRFPVADASELSVLIDKIMAYEQSDPDSDWRRRTLWVSDDAYSSGLIGGQESCYMYQPNELGFRNSQNVSVNVVNGAVDSTLVGELLDADVYTSSCRVGVSCENWSAVRQCFYANHAADFLDRWSQGWLWLSYQGHANYNVLGHENLLLTGSLSLLRNDNKPFVFFGMGCHVSDFIRSEEALTGETLGELLLKLPRTGAIATYGSCGFEFLSPNAGFMQVLSETMFERRVPDSAVFGAGFRNQWILGDVMARGELETLPLNLYLGGEMVAQYNLLGDPLLRMDGGAPRMHVSRGGQPVGEGAILSADAGVATAAIDLDLVDETGLDRIEVTDSAGRDYSALTGTLPGSDPRMAQLTVALPVYPQAYSVEVATFDAARPALRRTVLGLQVQLPLDFFVDEEPVVPGTELGLEPDLARAMRAEFSSPVDLVADDIVIEAPGVDVLALNKVGGGRSWVVSFDALAQPDVAVGDISLVLQGQPTLLVSSGQVAGEGAPVVLRHVVFPNPMQESARVVVEVEGTVDRARLSVYDLAGNEVNSREYTPGSGAAIALDFDARDRRGDELANGTYFYRISVEGPYGSARSDMGRMVIMR